MGIAQIALDTSPLCQMGKHGEKKMPQTIQVDHNDPLKPLHRLTNGPEPSKTIESDGSNIKKPS